MATILTRPPTVPAFWLRKDVVGEWRWTFYGANGEEIAVSSEGYINRADCEHGIALMKGGSTAEVWSPAGKVNVAIGAIAALLAGASLGKPVSSPAARPVRITQALGLGAYRK